MKRILRLVLINFFVFVFLLFAVNVAAITLYKTYKLVIRIAPSPPPESPYLSLPNYKNATWLPKYISEHQEVKSEYKAFIGWRSLPFTGETINIDNNGVRKTVQHPATSDTSKHVAFLGGSTMWGTGAYDAATIPSYFSEIAGGKYRAANLGEAGYNAYQSYLFLSYMMMLDYKPNIIVSYDGAAEFSRLFVGQNAFFTHSREAIIGEAVRGADKAAIFKEPEALTYSGIFLQPLIEFIDLVHLKLAYLGLIETDIKFDEEIETYDISDENISRAANGLLESWVSLKRLANNHGIEFYAVLAPTAVYGMPRIDHLPAFTSDQAESNPILYQKIKALLHEQKYQHLEGNVIDLTHAFDTEEYIFIDLNHVSPNGNRIIAQQIFDVISANNQ